MSAALPRNDRAASCIRYGRREAAIRGVRTNGSDAQEADATIGFSMLSGIVAPQPAAAARRHLDRRMLRVPALAPSCTGHPRKPAYCSRMDAAN